MTTAAQQLVSDFFVAIKNGEIPDAMLTDDFKAWTLSSGDFDRARYLGGIKLYAAVVKGGPSYEIRTTTVEGNRAIAEASASLELISGEQLRNNAVFVFELRDGKIAEIREYPDTTIAREKIGPLIQQVVAASQQ